MSPPIARGKRWSVAETPATRPDVEAPVCPDPDDDLAAYALYRLMAAGLDEGHWQVQRLAAKVAKR